MTHSGEAVICPYCESIAVFLTGDVVDDVELVGDCEACGREVTYDYDPTGIVRFENGAAVYG